MWAACRSPELAQRQVAPHGAEQADGHRHEEDEPPVDRRQHAAEDQPDEGPAERRALVDPEGQPRWSGGKASVRIAAELAINMAAPRPWKMRIDDQPDARGVARTSR